MGIVFYRGFYLFLRFVCAPIASLFNPKLREVINLRKNRKWESMKPQPLWFHCSSGEFEYAKPIIQKIKQNKPDLLILVTYFSPSYRKEIENYPYVDQACPLPWDQKSTLVNFINTIQPQKLIITKTDLWPELIYQVSKKNIPLYLIAANFHHHLKWYMRPLSKFVLKRFDHISCMSEEDKNILKKIAPQVSCSFDGDPRFEQVVLRLKKNNLANNLPKNNLPKNNLPKNNLPENSLTENYLQKNNLKRKTLIMGSTWPEDDNELLKTMNILNKKDLGFSFILVPHELDIKKQNILCSQLRKIGFEVCLYSKTDVWNKNDVLLVDKKGILGELYTWATFAFVGGSFKKTVHSVMEPLAAGCITFVGPHNSNNREAQIFKEKKIMDDTSLNRLAVHAVTNIFSGEDLAQKLELYNEKISGENLETIQKKITDEIGLLLGASDKIINTIGG